jgi:hypothetical protein
MKMLTIFAVSGHDGVAAHWVHRAGGEQRSAGGPAARGQRPQGQSGEYGHQPGHAPPGRQHAQQSGQAPGQCTPLPQAYTQKQSSHVTSALIIVNLNSNDK